MNLKKNKEDFCHELNLRAFFEESLSFSE